MHQSSQMNEQHCPPISIAQWRSQWPESAWSVVPITFIRWPDSTKPLPETMLNYHQAGSVACKKMWFKISLEYAQQMCTYTVTETSTIHQVHQVTHLIKLWLNSLRPRWNSRRFVDEIFQCIFLNENEFIFLNENVLILIKLSMKFIPKGPTNNISALDQIMAWRRPGNKPLSQPMMIILLVHICTTRPQWVNK